MFAKLQHRSAASLRPASSRRNLCSLSDPALDCSFSCVFCADSDLSSLESAVADKHRVLPVFSRNCRTSSPLEATLTSTAVSVDSKWFTAKLNLLDATLTKNTGEEGPLLTGRHSVPQCLCGNPSFASGRGTRVTEHRSRATPSALSVPLQPNAFGATIRKGTGILHDQGKQLRSPRCLRLGERTLGTARSWFPLQVVPGSSVLELDRSRVGPHPASGKDAGKRRVGKAGSVRLG